MRTRISWLPSATLIAVAACAGAVEGEVEKDPRLLQMTAGISRDSALRILGSGSSTGDSLANVYRREIYLIQGQTLEILFYSPEGLKEGQGAAAAESTLRPVVLTGNMVAGWGWTFFDSVARVNEIKARVR
jgi:hypothetical protein